MKLGKSDAIVWLVKNESFTMNIGCWEYLLRLSYQPFSLVPILLGLVMFSMGGIDQLNFHLFEKLRSYLSS